MIKVLLLDADGVVIKPRHKYFSNKYSEEHNIPVEEILPFFKGEYKDAAIGKADIREILPPYLEKWGWKGSIEDFLAYWFESEKDIDSKVIKKVQELRQKDIKCFLASDNERKRADYLMNVVGLKDLFDGGFFSFELGVTKSDTEFFKKIIDKLQVNPDEVEYWDDDPKNVEVAKSLGIKSNTYTSYEEFETQKRSS